MIDLFLNFDKIKKIYIEYYQDEKTLFILFSFILISIIISIIFSFSNSLPSWRVEFLNIFLFMLVSLSVETKELLKNILFIATICAYFDILIPFVFISLFLIKYIIFKLLLSIIFLFGLFELFLIYKNSYIIRK